ncbi:hypothetical protein Dda_0084 [Drechslerella dactyloides]|uniref:Uncharacterized protein n=1 Tax=Drechslerella dactyloides TaxID=74499 RepID=A0AAD6NMS7_DREDA|nr:hypothetical protein Dda_0084 [Drechslerella dactyloides]
MQWPEDPFDPDVEDIHRRYYTACMLLTSLSSPQSHERIQTEIEIIRRLNKEWGVRGPTIRSLDQALDRLAFLLVARGDGDCIAVALTKLTRDKVSLLATYDSASANGDPPEAAAQISGRSSPCDVQAADNLRNQRKVDIEQHAGNFFAFIKEYHILTDDDARMAARVEFTKTQFKYSIDNLAAWSRQLGKDLRPLRTLDILQCSLIGNEALQHEEKYFVPPPDNKGSDCSSWDEFLATFLPKRYLELESGSQHQKLQSFLQEHPELPTTVRSELDMVLWHTLFLWLFETLDRRIKSASKFKQSHDDAALSDSITEILKLVNLVKMLTHESVIFRRWISFVTKIAGDEKVPRLPPTASIFDTEALTNALSITSPSQTAEVCVPTDATATRDTSQPSNRANGGKDPATGADKAKELIKKFWLTVCDKYRRRRKRHIGNLLPKNSGIAVTELEERDTRSSKNPLVQQKQTAEEGPLSEEQSAKTNEAIPSRHSRQLSEEHDGVSCGMLESVVDPDLKCESEYADPQVGLYENTFQESLQATNIKIKTSNKTFQKAYNLSAHIDAIYAMLRCKILTRQVFQREFTLSVIPHDASQRLEHPAENLQSSLERFLAREWDVEETPTRVQQFLEAIPGAASHPQHRDRLLALNTENPKVHAPQHAEMLLLDHILNQGKDPNHTYMGISRPPCFTCEAVLLMHRARDFDRIRTRIGHGLVDINGFPERVSKYTKGKVFKTVNELANLVARDL